ncbi:hypothetical protein GN156_12045 [bacterium LRH843]|nr:hypothetical protein [bacterium LRH843]
MKRVLPYYYVPAIAFTLLSLAQLNDLTMKHIVMTILASIFMGLFAGFIFHIATILRKKLSKSRL